jgi:hypothetical protein
MRDSFLMPSEVHTSSRRLRQQLFPFNDGAAGAPPADQPAYFLVTSSGHSGSIWFAGSLNLHDEVLANVGLGHPLQSFNRYALNKDVTYMVRWASSALIEYGFHAPTGFVPAIPGKDVSKNRDLRRLPWWVFDELALVPAQRPYLCLGNVHGIILAHIVPAWREDPELLHGRQVVVMDLVRHPASRTESAIQATTKFHLEELEPAISAYIRLNATQCLEMERTYAIDFGEPRARAALIVYRLSLQNDAWAAELRDYPHIHRVLLERLQAEPVFAPENLGSGRQTTLEIGRPAGPRAQYELWSPWEREEFAQVAQRLALPGLYFPFGYDFSFVTRSKGSWFSEMLSQG